MMKRVLLLIAPVLLLLSACKKDHSVEPVVSLDKLTGKWTWVKSVGGFSGSDLDTPQSTGNTASVEFSDKNVFKSYFNGKLVRETSYHINTTNSSSNVIYENVSADQSADYYLDRVTGSTLVLRDTGYEGYVTTYSRAR